MAKKPAKPDGLCIIENCGRSRWNRGLCRGCYMAAYRMVKAGDATWEELVDKGLSLEDMRGIPRTPFGKAFEKLTESK